MIRLSKTNAIRNFRGGVERICLLLLLFCIYQSSLAQSGSTTNWTKIYNSSDTEHFDFIFTGASQQWSAPVYGSYKFEAWGAQGGNNYNYTSSIGGRGGYTSGTIELSKNDTFYVYVGEMPTTPNNPSNYAPTAGGWNGGGDGYRAGQEGYGGGGATDIRTVSGNWNSNLDKRIMVAAGGGGGGINNSTDFLTFYNQNNSIQLYGTYGGSGGGLNGRDGYNSLSSSSLSYYEGTGASQIEGGFDRNTESNRQEQQHGLLGKGGDSSTYHGGHGGGGGYYGGGGSSRGHAGGGGGSSYIDSSVFSSYTYVAGAQIDWNPDTTVPKITTSTGYVLKDPIITESFTMTEPDGSTNIYGHYGNGYARITLLSTNFSIINQVEGPAADQTLNFTYTVSGLSANTAHSYIRYSSSDGSTWSQSQSGSLSSNASGTISFQLKHNEKIVITIPAGKTISISRNENQHYSATNSLGSRNVANGISVNTTDTISFLNVHTDNISVRKIWHDNENSDGYRSGVCLELLADGFDTCHSAQLSAAGNAVGYTFSGVSSGDYSVIESGDTCPAGLPAAYQRVEWIQSTGTQYIDTGVKGSNKTGFDIDFILYDSPSSTPHAIIGVRDRIDEVEYNLNTYLMNPSVCDSGTFFARRIPYESVWGVDIYCAGLTSRNRQTIQLQNGYYTTPEGSSVFSPTGDYETAKNVVIFAANTENGVEQFSNVRLFRLTMYANNTTIRDFIPCYRISDGEVGLYDTVNGIFYTNQGTGTFYKGPDCIAAVVTASQISAVQNFVSNAIQHAYNRSATTNEIDSYTGRLMSGSLTARIFCYDLVFSQECIDRNLNDSDFVTMLYHVYLMRDPDSGGLNNWINRLSDQGWTRSEIAGENETSYSFGTSEEFKRLVADLRLQ